jgi:hypothetical protein
VTRKRWIGLLLSMVCLAISIVWGIALGRSIPGGTNDLQVIYYGTRCLMHGGDPYQLDQLRALYAAQEQQLPPNSIERPQAVTWYIYLPPTLLIAAPLAILPWPVAEMIWLTFLAAAIAVAAGLMMRESAQGAPGIALFLACLVLANCEIGFALGNAALLVVSLCTIAAWCFVRDRFVAYGVVGLALALAIKPHDAVLVWFYFLLAGGANRKRALQSLAITAVFSVVAVVWVGQVAPHWFQEWNSNVSALAVRGGLSDPGLSAERGRSAGQVIDLQAALSVLKDDPHFYDPGSHVVCGVMVLVWTIATVRARRTQTTAWHALAMAAPLSMLVTYHRPYDAKLLLLAIPACALLWRAGGWRGRAALAMTTAAIVFTADLPLTVLAEATARVDLSKMGIFERAWMMPLMRPAPLSLLTLAIFFLWVCVQSGLRAGEMRGTGLVDRA